MLGAQPAAFTQPMDAPPPQQSAAAQPGLGGMGAMQPAMVPNPAFAQWAQQAMAWIAEKQRREQQFASACELIRSDAVKRYKIDIEADSTVAADEQAEKQARTEFLQAVTPFMETMVPLAQQNPGFAQLISELIMFGVRAFPSSRSLEDAFETALQKMVQTAGKGQPEAQGGKNTKSPMEIKTEAAVEGGKLQVQQQANAIKLASIQAETQIAGEKLQQDQIQHQEKIALEARHMQGQEALDQARITRMESRAAEGLV